MMRTKVRLKKKDKKRLFRIVWEENAERLENRGWQWLTSWLTHDWGEKNEEDEFRYSEEELLEICVSQGCVHKREDGTFKLPQNWNRFTLQDKLEKTGFDPEE
jgi:hypothetical protein